MSIARPYETKEITYEDTLSINFLYKTLPGRILLSVLIRPIVSKFLGFFMDSGISRLLIPNFIKNNNICLDEYKDEKYVSFNHFFTREAKEGCRAISANTSELFAPGDGKLTAYPITSDSIFKIKNSAYDVSGLLQDKQLADEFVNGVCLILRLMPDDYHRYCYIDDGEIIASKKIDGVLHTVRPIVLQQYNIYTQNAREYAVLQTKKFGKVIQMEVGALFVGRIVNHTTSGTFKRGEEKGMFEFGGSTVVMLFQKDVINIDDSIYKNTEENKETVVKMGDKIGEKTLQE